MDRLFTKCIVVYPKIKNSQRKERLQSQKTKYFNYKGYCGRRYIGITEKDAKYFTTRSIYTRHKELTEKYKYDFDPGQSKALLYLKQRWEQMLFRYLAMFGDGYYLKKRSRKDKMNFKQSNSFTLKKNPIQRMVEILEKLDFLLVIRKVVPKVKNSSGENSKSQNKNEFQHISSSSFFSFQSQNLQHQRDESQQFNQKDKIEFSMSSQQKQQQSVLQIPKVMKFFDFFKGASRHHPYDRQIDYKKKQKIMLNIQKNSRKPLNKQTLQKMLSQCIPPEQGY